VNDSITVAILSSGVALMVPILWAALGEVVNEKAGILNIGIEGVMLFGAFAAALVLRDTHSFVLAALVSIPVGMASGAVLAYLYVYRGTDQIVTGIMFNLVALGVTTVMYEKLLTGAGRVSSLSQVGIPVLKDIPVLGPVLFEQTVLVYGAVAVAIVVAYLLRRTWFGLYVSAVGERPLAGETAGLDVRRLRCAALIIAGALVSFGGASIIITQSGNFLPGITSGQGFIALAVVVLGRFNPFWIVGGAALFGISTALQFQAQNVDWASGVPSQVWLSLPYVVTVIAVVVAKRAHYPDATAVPYQPPGTAKA
jgi:ABC-type uncharacterized transport system permease subunit